GDRLGKPETEAVVVRRVPAPEARSRQAQLRPDARRLGLGLSLYRLSGFDAKRPLVEPEPHLARVRQRVLVILYEQAGPVEDLRVELRAEMGMIEPFEAHRRLEIQHAREA